MQVRWGCHEAGLLVVALVFSTHHAPPEEPRLRPVRCAGLVSVMVHQVDGFVLVVWGRDEPFRLLCRSVVSHRSGWDPCAPGAPVSPAAGTADPGTALVP